MASIQNLVNTFASFRPCSTFLSIKNYENNEGEVSNFGLIFHVSYQNLLRKSLEIGDKFVPASELEQLAKKEVLESLQSSLDKYSEESIEDQKDHYRHFKDVDGNYIKGIKLHILNNELHLYGYQVSKQIIVPCEYKTVNSRPLTIAKNKIKSTMPVSKWRQFKLTPEKFSKINVENVSFVADESLQLINIT